MGGVYEGKEVLMCTPFAHNVKLIELADNGDGNDYLLTDSSALMRQTHFAAFAKC